MKRVSYWQKIQGCDDKRVWKSQNSPLVQLTSPLQPLTGLIDPIIHTGGEECVCPYLPVIHTSAVYAFHSNKVWFSSAKSSSAESSSAESSVTLRAGWIHLEIGRGGFNPRLQAHTLRSLGCTIWGSTYFHRVQLYFSIIPAAAALDVSLVKCIALASIWGSVPGLA